ncbi:MAG: thioredoxin family protein [Pseudomonadota bacterium]
MAATIEWQSGELGAAFALAASAGRPIFLYWSAGWCPPCSRLKADLFSRPAFAQRMRNLLPFQLDGDAEGAQALAAHHKLRAYPTLVLYAPDGREITRLPCELDGERLIDALDLALAAGQAGQDAGAALQAALAGTRALADSEWSLLSLYSWDTDAGQLLAAPQLAATLARLAQACPGGDAAARLHLHAQVAAAGRMVVGAEVSGNAAANAANAAAAIAAAADRLLHVFGDSRLARANLDILLHHGVSLIKWSGAHQGELVAALNQAARAFAADTELSVVDRLNALRLQMRLVRLGAPADGMAELVRQGVADALAETHEAHARHALLHVALGALHDAGLADQAEALLRTELAISHAPYYWMLNLAADARRHGDTAGMLDWYGQAWQVATGSATRLQWGVTYLASVVDYAPQDLARIEQGAQGMMRDIGAAGADAWQQRNRTQLQRLAGKLSTIEVPGEHTRALQRMLNAHL